MRTKSRKNDLNLPNEVANTIDDIGGLKHLASKIPPAPQLNNQIKIHHVLSDKTRLKILWAINCCELCPCVLKEFLKIPNPKLSYHLSVLEKAGLVKYTTKKNWRIYSITKRGKDALGCSVRFGSTCTPSGKKDNDGRTGCV